MTVPHLAKAVRLKAGNIGLANLALKDLRKLLRAREEPIPFQNFPRELRREKNDRAVILMCASYLDVGLKGAILLALPNKDAAFELFDDYGALHSLNAKIKVGEALGLFGPETRKNLDVIQTVRNAFAHSLLVVSFNTPQIAKACNSLTLPEQLSASPLLGKGPVKLNTPREKFVSVSMFTALAIWQNMIGFEDENGVRSPPPP